MTHYKITVKHVILRIHNLSHIEDNHAIQLLIMFSKLIDYQKYLKIISLKT